MAEKPGFFEPQKALKQKEIFEKTFAFVNKERTKLNSMKLAKQNKFFKSCTAQMKKMVRDGNQFQKDRMIYEINNAYFLRMEPYATHYFEVQNMLSKSPTINDVIADIYENTDFKLKRDPFLEYFWNP